jgi:hypothetical protein
MAIFRGSKILSVQYIQRKSYTFLDTHLCSALRYARYPTAKLWITEYGYDHVALEPTQDFFNRTAQFFDSTDYIERYSWFGAFRSNASNVGPNGAMLDEDGKLTSIGSWYLGGAETNNIPSAASSLHGNAGATTIALMVAGWIMTAILDF